MIILAGLTGTNLRDNSLIEQAINAIAGLKGLSIEELRLDDLVKASYLMKEYDLDYEDSFHLATAL